MGIWCANDLYENGSLIPFKTWQKRGARQCDFMIWRGLIHLVANQLDIRKLGAINRGLVWINSVYKEIDLLSQKEIRECFNKIDFHSLKQADFKAKNKFRLIHGEISEEEWKRIFCVVKLIKVTNHVKDLQFKILHRFLATNSLLYKMKKVESPRCIFCQLEAESLEHIVFNCKQVNDFWISVFEKWNSDCALVQATCNLKLVTFGLYEKELQPEQNALNLIILLAKSYIWRSKQSNSNLSFQLFQLYIQQTVAVCHQQRPLFELISRFCDDVTP
jgi:hypothetical protein